MERRSWRRSSSDKSPGESDSSGSVSSHSEGCSDDQDALRASPTGTSPEVSSNTASSEAPTAVNCVNEKLAAALSNIKAKEDLVKQHIKVAEEAVLGWEKAETEVVALKQQLEAGAQKNSALEDRIGHLDGALKECVRQLRQLREDQELKIQEALVKKTHEWESEKSEFESRLIVMQGQLDAKNVLAITSLNHDIQVQLDVLEKENSVLKVELLARFEDLKKQALERELSTRAAETASKQHLESIKMVAKLEAECRKLKSTIRKSTANTDQKSLANSVYVESLTDSQSDSGERLSGIDNEPSCSDSWASALIAELDQFKNNTTVISNHTVASIDNALMDDFLEMERLAALQEADRGSSSFELDADSDRALTRDNLSKTELEAMHRQIADLENKIQKMTTEKGEMEMDLAETRNKLKISCSQLKETENVLVELQSQVNLTNASKDIFKKQVEAVEAKRKDQESQLESANSEIEKLQKKTSSLESKLEEKNVLCAEFEAKCWSFEDVEEKRKQLESQLISTNMVVTELHEKVDLLERETEKERTLSTELAAKFQEMRDSVTKSKDLEAKLRFEIVELNVKVKLLEAKTKDERALSAEFASKLEDVEAERKSLNSQLELVHLESGRLHEKISSFEKKVEEAAEYQTLSKKLEAMEAERKALESQLSSARLEVEELHKKVGLFVTNINEERKFSAKAASELAAMDTRKRALESQLESAHLEVKRLHEKADLFEKEVAERERSEEYAARCESLEDKLSRKKHESEVQSSLSSSNIEAKTKQEKEPVVTGGNLEDCRKTIASLGRQLKSLATFEDFMLQAELEGANKLRSEIL